MLRRLAWCLLTAAGLHAAIWPERLGRYVRQSVSATAASGLDREYGLEAAETAGYGSFEVTGLRYKDATGAYAASLADPGTRLGNYVIRCTGQCPKDLTKLAERLPKLSQAPLPTLIGYLPHEGRLPHSERYILGPVSLARFAPQIPAGPVAFELGAEGEVAQYRTSAGDQTLALFSYPLPQMARQEAAAFQKLPGAVVKRSGPLVGVALPARDPNVAERLLSEVNYHSSVTLDETPPITIKPQSVGKMILAIFALTGILLAFCLVSGVLFGAFRMLRYRLGPKDAREPMILLHLGDK